MKLLPRKDVILTSGVDHADWNYDPLLAHIMRRRFALVRGLLPRERVARMLEIGFGSGVFMPDLARRCDELYGIDVHTRVAEVREALERRGVHTILSCQDAAHMAFPDAYFDAITAVSALEFIEDIDAAAREAARVLRRGGSLVAVMPEKSRFLDSMLRVFTGASAQQDYGNRRERVIPALLEYFRIVRTRRFAPVYTAYALEHKDLT